MRRISSRMTWWNKRALPALLTLAFAPPVAFIAVNVFTGRSPEEAVLIPGIAAVFGIVMMLYFGCPTVDEVWIDGDDLVVRNRGDEDRFPIAHIIDVEGSYMMSPEHIGIILQPPSRFGKKIRFAAPYRFFMFGTHPVAQELADRSGCFNRRPRD